MRGLLETGCIFAKKPSILNSPSVAVVILNYNGRNYLEQFLPFVLSSTYDNYRVIVADNGSSDGSVAFLRENHPGVEILAHDVNEGFAGGYNRALKNVQADYYVLLNSDVEVTPGWIDPIISLMEQDAAIGACQPKLLSYYNRHLFEYAGAAGGWIDALGYPFSRGRIFDGLEEDQGQYDEVEEVFWASGAAMFVRSHIFHELGGFDASFFAHQEEIDLCWRMQLLGYKIMACPKSVVYHVGAGTLPRGGRKVFLNFRNNLMMLSKNMTWQERLWKLPARWVLDEISAWKGLLGGDTAFFRSIIRAHWAWWRWTCRRDGRVKPRPMSSLTGVYGGTVVWQHFVLHRTRFSQIVKKNGD